MRAFVTNVHCALNGKIAKIGLSSSRVGNQE